MKNFVSRVQTIVYALFRMLTWSDPLPTPHSLAGSLDHWSVNGYKLSSLDEHFKSSVHSFTRVEDRYYFSLSNGSLYALGREHCRPECYGLLGLGLNVTSTFKPTEITGLRGVRMLKFCGSGANFVLALSTSGQLWSWGSNHEGQLGVGASLDASYEPLLVPLDHFVIDVCCAPGYALALSQTGVLWTWGANLKGRLGLGPDRWSRYFLDNLVRPLNYKLAKNAIPEDVVHLSRYHPVRVSGVPPVSWIACTHTVSYALTLGDNGTTTLYYWGSDTSLISTQNGSLQVRHDAQVIPTRLQLPQDLHIQSVVSNVLNAFILTPSGAIHMIMFNRTFVLHDDPEVRFASLHGNDWHSFLVAKSRESGVHVHVWHNIRYVRYAHSHSDHQHRIEFEEGSNVPAKSLELPFVSDAYAMLRVCSLPFMVIATPDKQCF